MDMITRLPSISPVKLLDKYRLFLEMGQSGTGKSTLQNYLWWVWWSLNPENRTYWLVQKSIAKEFRKLIPKNMENTSEVITNPLDKKWCGGYSNLHLDTPKFVIGDELSKIFDKYSNSGKITRKFSQLIGVHRPKRTTFLACDQEFDFIHKLKQISHWYILTGATDRLGKTLADNASWYVKRWFEYFTRALVELSEFNAEYLKKHGKGIAVVTNGVQTYKLLFVRPQFFTMDFSEIFKYLEPEDIDINDGEEERIFDPDDKEFHALMLAWHIAKAKFGQKPTKEHLRSIYKKTSYLFFEEFKDLPKDPRAEIADAKEFCGTTTCPFCNNRAYYQEHLERYSKLNETISTKIDSAVEKRIADLENGVANNI